MNGWVFVNGAKIDREFLAENIREAKGYEWEWIKPDEIQGHEHCMICVVTIACSKSGEIQALKSECGYVCASCYSRFF